MAVSLLFPEQLERYSHSLKTETPLELLHWHRNYNDYQTEEMWALYRASLNKFIVETLSMTEFDTDPEMFISNALKTAFLRLDNDISVEALPVGGHVNFDSLEVALSGACATVALIQHLNVHVVSVGDTRAVLGRQNEKGEWIAVPLSFDHNVENEDEVNRVKSEHPSSEASFVLKNNRLLGQLIPLRAFGDMRYKWPLKELKRIVSILETTYAQSILPMNYYTPPYLSCRPDVNHHKLTPQDKFLVLASDGLWENLSNEQVVKLVGEHMQGEAVDDHYHMEDRSQNLGELNKVLQKRKASLAMKSIDDNVATHLIRNTLGPEHKKISDMLTMPPEVVRYYRDDITVTVIFFDSGYIQRHTS